MKNVIKPRSVRRIVSNEARAYIDMAELLRRDDTQNTVEDTRDLMRIERGARALMLRDLDGLGVL